MAKRKAVQITQLPIPIVLGIRFPLLKVDSDVHGTSAKNRSGIEKERVNGVLTGMD